MSVLRPILTGNHPGKYGDIPSSYEPSIELTDVDVNDDYPLQNKADAVTVMTTAMTQGERSETVTSQSKSPTPDPSRPIFGRNKDSWAREGQLTQVNSDENLMSITSGSVDEIPKIEKIGRGLFWKHFVALIKKRYHTSKRDFKIFMFQILLPMIFIVMVCFNFFSTL